MDREHWKVVLAAVKRAARRLPRDRRLRYADWLVAATYLWAVAHDRCQSWACDRAHYPGWFRPRKLPSVSQFNRRVASSDRVRRVLQAAHDELGGPLVPTALSYLDGKALAVGPTSKDPDAARGRVPGGFAKGYKLHAWATGDRRIPAWCVLPLNAHGAVAARELLVPAAPPLSPRALVLADGNYDDRRLHAAVAARGGRLPAPPRGWGRHRTTRSAMGPARRASLAAWGDRRGAGVLARSVHRRRITVERTFSALCSCGGGLGPLPGWVRRLPRVRRWVGAKILLYHAKLRARAVAKTAR